MTDQSKSQERRALVDRLRSVARFARAEDNLDKDALLNQAADLIEAAESERERLGALLTDREAGWRKERAEREKLEAALRHLDAIAHREHELVRFPEKAWDGALSQATKREEP